MARSYKYIQQYEKEIIELKEQGMMYREIGETLGFTRMQVKKFFERQRNKEHMIVAGITFKKKRRPPKDDKFTKSDKVNELKYIIAHKDAKIKALEMEDELMRDFLSLTGSK